MPANDTLHRMVENGYDVPHSTSLRGRPPGLGIISPQQFKLVASQVTDVLPISCLSSESCLLFILRGHRVESFYALTGIFKNTL